MKFVLVACVLTLAGCAEDNYQSAFDDTVYDAPTPSYGYSAPRVDYLELIRLGGQMMQGPRVTTTNCIRTFTGMQCTSE